MFERMTGSAREVLVLAQDEARALRQDRVGTEHLLLGLLREELGLAARVLAGLGIELDDVRAKLVVGDAEPAEAIPFTPRVKAVLDHALREALALGHNYIGTEHMLLGLTRENEGVASRILDGFGADARAVRDAVFGAISGSPLAPRLRPHEGRWEYDVKTLDGASDTWVAQLEEWRTEGWELISAVPEGGAVRAIVERRRRSHLD